MAALPWEKKPIHVKFRSQDLSKSKEFFRTFECEEYKILSSQAISGTSKNYSRIFGPLLGSFQCKFWTRLSCLELIRELEKSSKTISKLSSFCFWQVFCVPHICRLKCFGSHPQMLAGVGQGRIRSYLGRVHQSLHSFKSGKINQVK